MDGQSPSPQNPKPVVKLTPFSLIGVSVGLLLAAVALLVWAKTPQHYVGAFFLFALLGAVVTFGFLGATGVFKTRNSQLGGSAGVLVTILTILLKFIGAGELHEIKGVDYLNEGVVPKARIILLETDRLGNEQSIEPKDNGQFRFTVSGKKKEYKFRIIIPDAGETNMIAVANREWLTLKVDSKTLSQGSKEPLADLQQLCQVENAACTVFLFDYLHEQLGPDELQTFQNLQAGRLDKDIRYDLESRKLLEGGIDFRVRRCSTSIKDSLSAKAAASTLRVPAVVWGFIKKMPDNKLVSVTTITFLDQQALDFASREDIGSDVTALVGLERSIQGAPLAIAALVVGDLYIRKGNVELARKTLLYAQELANGVSPKDKADFMKVVNSRLEGLEARNPAVHLQPIGGP